MRKGSKRPAGQKTGGWPRGKSRKSPQEASTSQEAAPASRETASQAVPQTAVPKHVRDRLEATIAEKTALENELVGHQEKLRAFGPLPREVRQAHPEASQHLARVDEVKARIAQVSFDHAELARAIALFSGGKNYQPPPG
jgi:hypothetical protein